MSDAYAVCRYIRHYHGKNGYLPRRGEIPDCTAADLERLEVNGIVQLHALYDGGPRLIVGLTDKGRRMANEQSRARRSRPTSGRLRS